MLFVALLTLIFLLVWLYPRIQEHREEELAKRLEKLRESSFAGAEIDRLNSVHQHEADFFRRLM